MCIAIYKPMGKVFPSKSTLEVCFDNNPDGAGYMVAVGDTVVIHKGFMDFRSFWKSLQTSREFYGDDKAYVMHFRISTQGGIRKDGCHPFPLSGSMDDLRQLDTKCDIGIAHNGIINMCSGYGKVDYSDTMEFITEYLSLIIDSPYYYRDENKLKLIERMCGSRLAILAKDGHCMLIGNGWSEDDGVWYSNDSYRQRKYKTVSTYTPTLIDWGYDWKDNLTEDERMVLNLYEEYDECIDSDGLYDFSNRDSCPVDDLADSSFCDYCRHFNECFMGSEVSA